MDAGLFMAVAGAGGRVRWVFIPGITPSGRRPTSPSLVLEAAVGAWVLAWDSAAGDASDGSQWDLATGITRGMAAGVGGMARWELASSTTLP